MTVEFKEDEHGDYDVYRDGKRVAMIARFSDGWASIRTGGDGRCNPLSVDERNVIKDKVIELRALG